MGSSMGFPSLLLFSLPFDLPACFCACYDGCLGFHAQDLQIHHAGFEDYFDQGYVQGSCSYEDFEDFLHV